MELHEKQNRKIQYWSTLAVSMSSLCLAATAAWPSPVLYKFHSKEVHFEVTAKEIPWVIAMSSIGFIIGSILTRYVADNFGRKTTILISSLPMVIGSLTVLIGWNTWFLYVARFVWGVGTGMAGTVVPMYMAEISAKDIRGTLTTYSRVVGNLGALIMIAGGPFVSYTHINIFLLVLPFIYFTTCCFIPESPYYYLKDGRVDEAQRVMLILQDTTDVKSLDEAVSTMEMRAKEEMSRGSSIRELVTSRLNRKLLIISAGLKITQILSGVGTMKQYLGVIMEESGISLKISTMFLIFGVINFIIGIISSVLVDRFGRRPLFFASSLCLGLTLFVVGTYFFLKEIVKINHEAIHPYAIVAFVGIVISVLISTLGVTPLSYLIPAEIFAINVKSIALSAVNIFAAILGSTVALAYQAIKDIWGLCGVFWFFGSIATIGAIFTYLFLPETKGKSLDEIQMELRGRRNCIVKDDNEVGLPLELSCGDNGSLGDAEISKK